MFINRVIGKWNMLRMHVALAIKKDSFRRTFDREQLIDASKGSKTLLY